MFSMFISILFFLILFFCSVQISLLTFRFMSCSEFQISTAFLQMLGFIDDNAFHQVYMSKKSVSHAKGECRKKLHMKWKMFSWLT